LLPAPSDKDIERSDRDNRIFIDFLPSRSETGSDNGFDDRSFGPLAWTA
jgi:hypothetical protein